ncbi:MAG TPA: sigma 54-interacting transcriptional regulator [Pirellulales bacterium]|jgi:DNA-binding NtrC family response regulator|nr:sigma 54-interacting transcriptional regulator [Pirellulales bacterium]
MFAHPSVPTLIGPSAWAVSTRQNLPVRASDFRPTLIVGPASSGRAFLARLLHLQSERAHAPFVPVSCDRLRGALFATQVFGCAADRSVGRPGSLGAIRSAHGGTILFRNVERLEPAAQWELFGYLLNQDVLPCGGAQRFDTDVRVIASCSTDIFARLRSGTFDLDLYQALSATRLETVALQQRAADIVPLAEHFLQARCATMQIERALEPSAEAWLTAQSWPGNIGQLRSLMESLATPHGSASIDHETLRLSARSGR